MYQHILVPVAFDATHEDGRPALRNALSLLAPGGKLTLVHVMEPVPVQAQPYMPENFERETATALTALLQKLGATAAEESSSEVEVSEQVLVGHASHEIIDLAARSGVDLIIVHSHRPGFSDYFLGSTAARVVRHARCSVLVMR